MTLQGEIRYKRRIYKSYKDGKSYYLLGILIGIMKHKRYSQEVMKRAIKSATFNGLMNDVEDNIVDVKNKNSNIKR